MTDLGGESQRLFGAIYDLAGGDPANEISRPVAAEQAGLQPDSAEFFAAAKALEDHGYVVSQAARQQYFKLSGGAVRRWDPRPDEGNVDFGYCPRHNISFPEGSSCPYGD